MAQSFQNVTLSLTLPISCQICLGKVTHFHKTLHTRQKKTHRVVQCVRELCFFFVELYNLYHRPTIIPNTIHRSFIMH